MDIIIRDTQPYEMAYESLYELCNVTETLSGKFWMKKKACHK